MNISKPAPGMAYDCAKFDNDKRKYKLTGLKYVMPICLSIGMAMSDLHVVGLQEPPRKISYGGDDASLPAQAHLSEMDINIANFQRHFRIFCIQYSLALLKVFHLHEKTIIIIGLLLTRIEYIFL